MIEKKDVIDIRTGHRHSIAIITENNAKWFVEAGSVVQEELEQGENK